jgi:hypothetical protein
MSSKEITMSESIGDKVKSGSSSSVIDVRLKRLGLSEDISSDPLKVAHVLSAYGVVEWASEAIAVSLIGLAALRTHWEALAAVSDTRDGVFTLGDCWGELIAAEALLVECLDAVSRSKLSGSELRSVAALCTSVLVLREGMARLAERRQKPPPPVVSLNQEVLAAAERTILD